MVCKRPFLNEESYEFGCKHPRQNGETAQQLPVLGITHCYDGPQKLFSDEGESAAWKSQHEGTIPRGTVPEDGNGPKKEFQLNTSSDIASDVWGDGNVIGESSEYLAFFPHYFELDHRVNGLVPPHDSYSACLDLDPRIPVSVGPDHQADVPEWDPQSCFGQSFGSSMVHKGYGNMTKLEGTCVISKPYMESSACDSSMNGGTRNYCNCLYKDSISCVKQHVMEAREKLKENLGQKIFEELGFSDMGEEVAKKWSEEEEHTFHEVVLSNPASQGKNFWAHLSAIFPFKTKGDLVSYYFNVFMLRKRAEQNIFDPSNTDSDNDEWQISEIGISEEDDDSAVESVLDGVEEGRTETGKDDADSVNHIDGKGEEDGGDADDVLGANGGNFVGVCGLGPDPAVQFSVKVSNTKTCQDIEDDSCTSYEYQCDKVDSLGLVDLRNDDTHSRIEQAPEHNA